MQFTTWMCKHPLPPPPKQLLKLAMFYLYKEIGCKPSNRLTYCNFLLLRTSIKFRQPWRSNVSSLFALRSNFYWMLCILLLPFMMTVAILDGSATEWWCTWLPWYLSFVTSTWRRIVMQNWGRNWMMQGKPWNWTVFMKMVIKKSLIEGTDIFIYVFGTDVFTVKKSDVWCVYCICFFRLWL